MVALLVFIIVTLDTKRSIRRQRYQKSGQIYKVNDDDGDDDDNFIYVSNFQRSTSAETNRGDIIINIQSCLSNISSPHSIFFSNGLPVTYQRNDSSQFCLAQCLFVIVCCGCNCLAFKCNCSSREGMGKNSTRLSAGMKRDQKISVWKQTSVLLCRSTSMSYL